MSHFNQIILLSQKIILLIFSKNEMNRLFPNMRRGGDLKTKCDYVHFEGTDFAPEMYVHLFVVVRVDYKFFFSFQFSN